MTSTSQPAPGDFRRQYQFLASHFADVLSINLTGKASGTLEAARSAAERVNALEEFELVTLTPAIQSERGLSNPRGALIVGVSLNVQRVTGLREGDLIVGINRVAVRSAEEAAEYLSRLQRAPGRVSVRMLVERSGRELYTSFYL